MEEEGVFFCATHATLEKKGESMMMPPKNAVKTRPPFFLVKGTPENGFASKKNLNKTFILWYFSILPYG